MRIDELHDLCVGRADILVRMPLKSATLTRRRLDGNHGPLGHVVRNVPSERKQVVEFRALDVLAYLDTKRKA